MRLIGVMHRYLSSAFLFVSVSTASGMVGNAPTEESKAYRSEIMILNDRHTLCTGVVLARDLVLTAAHCIEPGASHRLYEIDAQRQPAFFEIASIAVHPQFSKKTFDANRATADLALLKAVAPLPARYLPAKLSPKRARVTPGERFTIIGYGVTIPRDTRSAAVLHRANVVATGQPGNLQLRLADPVTKGEAFGLGACTGDSGGPVYEERDGKRLIYGVISWTTAPKLEDGCGGLTGATPLELYLKWITDTAQKFGSPLAP